jgi:hypothetical protein
VRDPPLREAGLRRQVAARRLLGNLSHGSAEVWEESHHLHLGFSVQPIKSTKLQSHAKHPLESFSSGSAHGTALATDQKHACLIC